ncbi:melatonin receptor type 1B-A-like [Lytechinus pictus]|uniref:melatonin receptor type 1B-A-like n=1 Tax=Lytechinus pictus TaxID=7653 RepID=UPI0030BA233C
MESVEATVGPSIVPFNHRIAVAFVLVMASVIGLFGNSLVIISVIVTKKLRTITNILVVNLAFADVFTCACLPFQVVGLLSRTRAYPLPEIVCDVVAGVVTTSVFGSVCNLVAIAFVRWYVITKSIRGHQGLHTPKKIFTLALIIWVFSTSAMVIPPVLGIGTLGYSEYYATCSLRDTNELEFYYIVLQGSLIAIALLLTFLFYIRILRHVLRHNQKFRVRYSTEDEAGSSPTEVPQNKTSSSTSTGTCPPMIKAINQKEVEITKNLFLVVCAFMLCILPNVINFLIPGTSVLTLYSVMILLVNSVVNPIIYGLKHPNFQEAFKKILTCRKEMTMQVST